VSDILVEVVEVNPTAVTVVEASTGASVIIDLTPTHEVVITDVGAQGRAGRSINVTVSDEAPTLMDPGDVGDLWIVTG
jgi:hypothetical protein